MLMDSSASNRPLTTFTIPPAILSKLTKAGYITAAHLGCLRPSELSSSAEVTIGEAADVLDLVKQTPSAIPIKSALDLLYEECHSSRIVTMSAEIDKMLDGGVAIGKVTEIAGVAGVGKTQFCLQLCVDVQIPEQGGGLQGQAVFIDTEGSFNISRIQDMSEACVQHCSEHMSLTTGWSPTTIANNIFVFRCREITDLVSCVMVLHEFLLTHPKVKLIVVDSLAFHFRHDLENAGLRSRVLHKIASQLTALAVERCIAVVVTNQMTTKISSSGLSFLAPSLGASWGHAPSQRILLDWDPSHSLRWATLIKSSSLPTASALYQVTKDGIRDAVADRALSAPQVVAEDGVVGTTFEQVTWLTAVAADD